MTAGVAEVVTPGSSVERHEAEARCPVCVVTMSLDDEQPKTGALRWKIARTGSGFAIGTADHFRCPNGHSSDDDPDLLKVFPSRRF